MKVLVVDDEQPARKKLISLLKECNMVDNIIEANNGVEAVQKILNEKPEIIFLDIQMPGMTGFEVIEQIGPTNIPPVIFVTAFDQYALNAFDVNAVDYLLKPFDKERFQKTLNRVFEEIKIKKYANDNVNLILNEIKKEKKHLERFLVSSFSKYFFISVNDVHYISSAEKYVELHTLKGKYLIRETMNNIEQSLDPAKFVRVHRSYIVNVEQIQEMQPWSHGDYIIILKSGEKVNMSRRYSDRLIK